MVELVTAIGSFLPVRITNNLPENPAVQHTIQQEMKGVITFIVAIWVVFALESISPLNLTAYGVTPRTVRGLFGIPCMPFLHLNLQHLVSNTWPLFILLMLLAGSRANSWQVVIAIVLLSGGLLWMFGRGATHIGASGLIFGLIAFLIASGFLEKRLVPMAISVMVMFLYGGSLLLGMVPRIGSQVSWDGHLFGALAGAAVAYGLTTKPGAGTAMTALERR